jgi:hypothetical protein
MKHGEVVDLAIQWQKDGKDIINVQSGKPLFHKGLF